MNDKFGEGYVFFVFKFRLSNFLATFCNDARLLLEPPDKIPWISFDFFKLLFGRLQPLSIDPHMLFILFRIFSLGQCHNCLLDFVIFLSRIKEPPITELSFRLYDLHDDLHELTIELTCGIKSLLRSFFTFVNFFHFLEVNIAKFGIDFCL